MRKPPKIRKKRIVAQTRMFCVEELDLEFDNGVHASYERLQPNYRAAVLVVPVQDDGETGIPGVTVELLICVGGNANGVIATTTTDVNGL